MRNHFAKKSGPVRNDSRWMGSACQWKEWPTSLPAGFDAEKHPLFRLTCPTTANWEQSKCRVLWVVGHVDTTDLKERRLMSGTMRSLIEGIDKMATQHKLCEKRSRAHAAVNYNFFKTYNLTNKSSIDIADQESKAHVLRVVKKLKPTHIIILGDEPAEILLGSDEKYFRGWKQTIEGVDASVYQLPDLSSGYGGQADDEDEDDKKAFSTADLIGYCSRIVMNAYNAKHTYRLRVGCEHVLINKMSQFKKLAKRLEREPIWACDTETTGLQRVTNTLLTMQFAFDTQKAYILPINHMDAVWTPRQLLQIRARLAAIFSKPVDPLLPLHKTPTLIVGHGLKFDATVLREWLGIQAIYHRFWDTGAGEFLLDENIGALRGFGTPALNLQQIARSYGADPYGDIKFSKADRTTIAKVRLKGDVLKYMAYDVTCPLGIRLLELQRASHMEHEGGTYLKAFEKLVVLQLNNHIQFQSKMEHRGIQTDVAWLKELRGPTSALRKLRDEFVQKLRDSKAGKKAAKLLAADDGAPEGTLFDDVAPGIALKFGKAAHQAAFFVRALKLKPLGFRKDKLPKINKEFFSTYKEVPEVAWFAELTHIKKLISAYVINFLNRLTTDTDFAHDHRIRASYGFSETGTGRGNSYDPNLQNIPTRGKHSKAIKRSFSSLAGFLKAKLDYSAHEVRMWGIGAGDRELCKLFDVGRDLRRQYRKTGDKSLQQKIDTEGDIHVQNVAFFYQRPLESIKTRKEVELERDAVKSIAFGTVYGRGAASIAKQIKQAAEKIKQLQAAFFARFKRAAKWLVDAKRDAVTRGYTTSVIGRRRNLSGYLLDDEQIRASCERRGCNAPIQSIAADIAHTAGHLMTLHYEQALRKLDIEWKWKKHMHEVGGLDVSVHDSLGGEAPIELILIYVHIMQWCATIGAMQYYEKHWNLDFITPLEIEVELMTNDAGEAADKWDWHDDNLMEIAQNNLKEHCKLHGLKYRKQLPKLTRYYCGRRLRWLHTNFPILPKWEGSALKLGGGAFAAPFLKDKS